MLIMPFAGFTFTFCILPGNLSVVLQAKNHWEDTAYKTSPTRAIFFFPKITGRISASSVDQQRQGKAQLSASRFRKSSITTTCLSTPADCIGANDIKQADGMRWGQTELFEYSPTCQPALINCIPVQTYRRKWDFNTGWFASCARVSNPFSQSNTQNFIMLSQKEV